MDASDRDRTIERYVAGLPVGEDDLVVAVTARAIDATIVVEALLRGLDHGSPVIRARAAKRVGRMADIPQRLSARLQQVEASDADHRVRESAEVALLAHRVAVPSDPRPPRTGVGALPAIWLRPLVTRSPGPVRGVTGPAALLRFVALDRAEAPAMRGELVEEDDELRIELRRLPERYAGCRLAVYVRSARSDEATEIAVAGGAVSETGAVMIPIDRGTATIEDLAQRLRTELELVVVD